MQAHSHIGFLFKHPSKSLIFLPELSKEHFPARIFPDFH